MRRHAFALFVAGAALFGASLPAIADENGFPLTIENCGATVTLNAPASRIFMVNYDPIPLLAELDVLDRVVARTEKPLDGVYDQKVYDQLEQIELIASETSATGGSIISLEAIIAAEPDLVLAAQNAVDRELLAAAGIATYSPPAYCQNLADGPQGTASFERVYDQVEAYGAMFGVSDLAAQKIAELKADVAKLSALNAGENGTGVAIYVAAGGKTLYPYGDFSMITPIFEAAGLTNVYAGTQDRVFEASLEDIIGRDPETIVLLYSMGEKDDLVDAFMSIPGIEAISAVRNNRVIVLKFPFTDPPTPLSIKGAEVLAAKLDALP